MNAMLFNFVAFQGCWFANVLGAANATPWLGPVATGVWMIVHFVRLDGPAATEARVLISAVLLGWAADSTLVLSGLLAFPPFAQLGQPSPVWMVALWVCFAATLRHSLGWLRGRWLVGAALGAVGGPLAYLGGESLGALILNGNLAIAAVSLQFALATPILMAVVKLAERAAQSPDSATTSETASEAQS